MLPIWLVYILITLFLIIDVLLVLGVVVVGAFLVAYILFNIATALLGRKIDRYIRDRLDRMKHDLESRPQGKGAGTATGHVKTIYSILYKLYRIYDITTALIVALIAFVLLTLGMAGLAIVNFALYWLLNAYVL